MNNIKLKKDIEYYKRSKENFLEKIKRLNLDFNQRRLNHLEYKRQLNTLLKGRPIESWLNYYENNIRNLERELRIKEFEIRSLSNRKILFIIILFLIIAAPLIFVLKNTYTGYVVYMVDKGDIYIKNGLVNEKPKGNHAVMKFDHVLSDDEREELEKQGIKLLSYLPENTWIVSTTKDVKKYKISKDNKVGFRNLVKNEDNTVNLTVVFYDDVDVDVNLLDNVNLISKIDSINGLIINTDANNMDNLLDNENVQWIEPQLPEPIVFNDGSRNSLGVDILYVNNLTGLNIVIGEWDAAHADAMHDDLSNRIIYGDSADVHYHSTHVAGTAIGSGNISSSNGGSELQWRGIAPDATIISYEWFNDDSELENEYVNAIDNYSISISTNSWGLNVGGYYPCEYMGNYTTANVILDNVVNGGFGRKVLVIWAAGNDRSRGLCGTNKSDLDNNYMNIPPYGTGKNILTIGAINSDDNTMTSYSSWGPSDDGRIKPELVAPGDENTGDGGIKSTIPGNRYTVYYGTSMAAPAVAGVSALIIENFIENYNYEPWPSTIKAILINSAIDLGREGVDYSFGYGKINATAAIEIDKDFIINDTLTNSSKEYKIDITNETELRLTLVWDDAAPTINSIKQLVNDLDLVVVSPNSTRHYPFTLYKSNPSQIALKNQSDHVNVIEQVLVDNPENGEWSIIVNNTNLITQQDFSLVSNMGFNQEISATTTLVSPENNLITNDTTITFNCSATYDNGLRNISLYTDREGKFAIYESRNISGVHNSTLFNLNLTDIFLIWNCLSNGDSSYDWGDYNYTLMIDTLSPELILLSPENNSTFDTNVVTFSYSVLDKYNSTCNLKLNDNAESVNETEITKTLSNNNYTWSMNCVDQAGNVNNSEIRSFIVNYIEPVSSPPSGGGSSGGSGGGGGGGGSKGSQKKLQEEEQEKIPEKIEPVKIIEEQKPLENQITLPVETREKKQFRLYYYTPFFLIILYLLFNIIKVRMMKHRIKRKRFIRIKR